MDRMRFFDDPDGYGGFGGFGIEVFILIGLFVVGVLIDRWLRRR